MVVGSVHYTMRHLEGQFAVLASGEDYCECFAAGCQTTETTLQCAYIAVSCLGDLLCDTFFGG
jgi:hypothetical protein